MASWWHQYPWRMIQTNLREIDMEDMDARVFVEQLQQFQANVVLFNVGGIIASYATKLEDQFQSPFLHGDQTQDVVRACHEAGIRVIARMDFSKVRRPIYERHPDWAYRTKDGAIIDYNGDVHACICGGYQQERAYDILRECLTEIPLDGVFINMGGFQVKDYSYRYYGICHCENCRRRFRERFGLELPDREDMNDPVFRKYKVFQKEVLAGEQAKLVKLVRGINPDIAIAGVDFHRLESNTEYKRPLPFWQYSAASNTRMMRGLGEDESLIVSNTTVDFIGFFYRHVAVNAEEQELRLWQDIANFGAIDYYLIGRLDNHEDKSGYANIQKVFRYKAAHEEEYRGIRSKADVLLFRGDDWVLKGEELGWIRTLTEAHMLFDETKISGVHPESRLDRYKAIILPDSETLPGWLCAKLDAYVEAGGCLIVTAGTGKYDECLDPPEAYPLASIGVKRIQYLRQDMTSAMLHVEDGDLSVFDSFRNDRVLYFGDQFLFASYAETAKGYLRLIPPHPYGPPERCYYTQVTDIPGIVVNAYGKGKGIMIPWTPGALFHRDGYANTFRFMRDVLRNLAGVPDVEAKPFTPMVAVTVGVARDGSRELVQLVNQTGHFGTSYLPPVPVAEIALRIPCERQPAAVKSQTTGASLPYQWRDGTLTVTVPRLEAFEGLLVQF